jgi:hypothetical protein
MEALDSQAHESSLERADKEIISLLRKRIFSLTLAEENQLCLNFKSDEFYILIPYIHNSFKFYSSRNVKLPCRFKQELILKFINNLEQIITCTEDLFITSQGYLIQNETDTFRSYVKT